MTLGRGTSQRFVYESWWNWKHFHKFLLLQDIKKNLQHIEMYGKLTISDIFYVSKPTRITD